MWGNTQMDECWGCERLAKSKGVLTISATPGQNGGSHATTTPATTSANTSGRMDDRVPDFRNLLANNGAKKIPRPLKAMERPRKTAPPQYQMPSRSDR